MEREHWLIIIAAISMSTFGLSYLFGYFQLQWYFALGIFGAVGGGFYFAHNKTIKIHGWREVIEQNKEDLRALGIITETGYKNVRGSRVDEHLDVNDRGRYWYIIIGDNPTFTPLLFSAKTGKMVHWDMRGTIDESPLKSARDKPIAPQPILGTHDIQYKETIKPEKQKPASQ